MDDQTRNGIIIAAVNAAGPMDDDNTAGWSAKVASLTASIAAMCSPESSLAKVVNGVAASKVFTAVVTDVVKEQSSTRGLVTLKAKPSKFHTDGVEQARTDRTDSSEAARNLARRLRGLIGHKVALWVEVEEINGGAAKVRVIRHVEDLGVATQVEADAA
ncbi:MAG: hypothetical protein M3Y35_18010 [Actinomycetota bacterium]|nr:hypothetical protein [Actinomycetota bacterium]